MSNYTKEMKWWKENQGKYARDKVTGFEGFVTGYALHLYGCNTIGLTPKVDKDGKIVSGQYFDEGRLEIIDEGVKPEDVQVKKPGCGDNPTSTAHNP